MSASFSFDVQPPDLVIEPSPLERCLLQVRFSRTPELLDEATERSLAGDLPELPVRSSVRAAVVPLTPDDGGGYETLRTFESVDGLSRASVASDFCAYETSMYTTRDAMLGDAAALMRAVANARRPARVNRVGIRYTNAFDQVGNLGEWIRPPLLGWVGALADPTALQSQLLYATLAGGQGTEVAVRTALVPAGAVFEPGAPITDHTRWLLDIDSYDETARPGFEPGTIGDTLENLAKDAYKVFAWAAEEYVQRGRG